MFDRLTGHLSSPHDGTGLSADGLQRSICLDLERLLNTRNGMTVRQFLDCDGGVMHYGTPDTLALSTLSDQVLLSNVLKKALVLFEPRLSRIEIRVVADVHAPQKMNAQIRGAVNVNGHHSRVDFDLELGGATAKVGAGGSVGPKGVM